MEDKLVNDSSFVRMHVSVDDPKTLLTQQDVYKIEKYILEQICASRGEEPHFQGYVFCDIEGALIINSHVDSVTWLQKAIKSYVKKALKITDLKDVPQYTTVVEAQVPQFDDVLELLETQKFGLRVSGWKILSTSNTTLVNGWPGLIVTLLIDDPSREFLERNSFKLFLGITTITFQRLHPVSRCETTGKIVRIAEFQPTEMRTFDDIRRAQGLLPVRTGNSKHLF